MLTNSCIYYCSLHSITVPYIVADIDAYADTKTRTTQMKKNGNTCKNTTITASYAVHPANTTSAQRAVARRFAVSNKRAAASHIYNT